MVCQGVVRPLSCRGLIEGLHGGKPLLARSLPGVEHMPTLVMLQGEIRAQRRIQLHERRQMIGGEIGCHQVKKAMRDVHLHIGIQRHPNAQIVYCTDEALFEFALEVKLPGFEGVVVQQVVAKIGVYG